MSLDKSTNLNVNKNEMSFLEHLKEVRKRLIFLSLIFIVIFIVSFFNAKKIYLFLVYPLQKLYGNHNVQLIYTSLQEGFLTYVKLAFFVSLFVIIPFVFIQIWRFISPALYKSEKNFFLTVFTLTPILFWAGAIISYLWIIPTAWKFFLGFEVNNHFHNISINLVPKVNEYLSLSLHLIFGFALIFLLPIFIFLLIKLNILTINQVKSYRRYIIVLAFIIGAIATPPDPLSQVIMAISIIVLYELSLILVKILK